ncbi:MAG: phosphate/phosphite/phosphonate ABC transporter substrate-binding protein [Gammaproteobacteria bacterium]|nr:phosphate/phosphite/phosphonate ABC transporter substrate-binding protein [Gammaproteobacteria bacterium]
MAIFFNTCISGARVIFISLLLLVPVCHAQTDEDYTFAVVPQFEQRKLFGIWKPVIDELNRRTGLHLKLVTTLTVSQFEREISKGSFDFIYANPYYVLRVNKRQGYIPLVRDNIPLTGILVVAKSSPVRNVKELDGKTLAIPSPNALGASLLMRADLENIFHIKMTALNVKTHSSVYLNVATGTADAGGGVQKTFDEQAPGIRDALRVLYTTREMPSHPIAAHPRVPKSAREAVRKALLEMAETPAGQTLLADIPMPHPVPASIEDYLIMQDWGLEKYWVEPIE